LAFTIAYNLSQIVSVIALDIRYCDRVEYGNCIEDAQMKTNKIILLVCAVLLSSVGSAWADRGHWRGNVGIYVGPGAFWGAPYYRPYYPGPYYYPQPYYQPAPVIITQPAPPPVYIEQSNVITEQTQEVASTNYWYYCRESKTYYPYVKECKGEWQKVLPQPAK
jgi:hypothetical protein